MAVTYLDIGPRCIKYVLIMVNLLFLITGVSILGFGTGIYKNWDEFSNFLDPIYFSPGTLIIVVGVVVIVIGFFGCFGALKENTCMIRVFAISLTAVVVLEVAVTISVYAFRDGVGNHFAGKLDETMHNYDNDSNAARAMDYIQSRLRCCGIESRADWDAIQEPASPELYNCWKRGADDGTCLYSSNDKFNVFWDVIDDAPTAPINGYSFPPTCCTCSGLQYPTACDLRCGGVFKVGCVDKLNMIIHRNLLYLGTGFIAIILIQLTGVSFACILGRAIKGRNAERERRRWGLFHRFVDGYHRIGKSDSASTLPIIHM